METILKENDLAKKRFKINVSKIGNFRNNNVKLKKQQTNDFMFNTKSMENSKSGLNRLQNSSTHRCYTSMGYVFLV